LNPLNSTKEEFENMNVTEEEIKVTTGEEAVPYSWPWQASVQIAAEHICGGAVLAREWVVTAAHCLHSRQVPCVLLSNEIQINLAKSPVKQHFIHPSFNKTTLDCDVALLQLAEPLEFSPSVLPVCLPAEQEVLQPSRTCVVTGWGAPEGKKLQQLEVPILAPDICQSYYINLPSKVTQGMICAGFPLEEGKDSCTGDSGGPLVCPSEDNLGWGLGCGRKNYPGVYTNVGFFVDWIKKNINSSGMYQKTPKQLINPFAIVR
uniref:Peptidase S1 domain-containing protein n=1 Tax=Ficedula albicollis TaxID=59894 RepID=A0A803VA53_FICAL